MGDAAGRDDQRRRTYLGAVEEQRGWQRGTAEKAGALDQRSVDGNQLARVGIADEGDAMGRRRAERKA
jgi:hypothetical protein